MFQVFESLSRAGNLVLAAIATEMGISPSIFFDVMDAAEIPQGHLTSSVLRVCKYSPGGRRHELAFGEHTDSSFVTVALCSTVPGLEIKSISGDWIKPETAGSDILDAIVFVGNCSLILFGF